MVMRFQCEYCILCVQLMIEQFRCSVQVCIKIRVVLEQVEKSTLTP